MMTTTMQKACLLMLILECFVESGELRISENCRRKLHQMFLCRNGTACNRG